MATRYKVKEFIAINNSGEETDPEFIKECIQESMIDNDIEISGELEVTKLE